MDYKVNYITVIYIGPNRDYASYQDKFKNDPMFFARHHVDFLNRCENSKVELATFVFNDDMPNELKQLAIDTVSQIKTMRVEIVFRTNVGFSYGAWNDMIKKNINDFDYFFLIEDDYVPVETNFYEDFVDRCTLEYPFVSTYVDNYEPGKFCASCSNSMIRADVCKIILEKYNELFLVTLSDRLQDAWHTQMNFLNLFTQSGYGMRDILHKYSTPHNSNCHINKITVFGNKDFPPMLVPIIP
jgi:hypothetical protein